MYTTNDCNFPSYSTSYLSKFVKKTWFKMIKCIDVHVHDLSFQLNRANALLFKMRKYFSLKTLRSICFAIFDSYINYCYLVWAQDCSLIEPIVILQKRLLELFFNLEISIPVPYSNKIPSWYFKIKFG